MIGDRIRKERISKNITQEYLAKALDVSPSTIGMYEQNRRIPDNEMTIKIANYFGVSTDYLFGRTNIKKPYKNTDKISNAIEDDPELRDFWNELREREDLQLLFKQTKDLSPKGIKQIIRIIKAIEDEESREH